MNILNRKPAAFAMLIGLSLIPMTSPARADVKDYEFRLVQAEQKSGDAVVAVRLIDKRSGKAVPDAVIIAKRIDMAPEAMAEMTSPIQLLPPSEPGVYRFKTKLTMEGRWRLSLGAKVQGENGTVESQLVLKATP